MNASEEKAFHDFGERNSGTVIAVRHTPAVQRWLNLTLKIYLEMLARGFIRGNGGIADQGAFREAFFVNRHEITEQLLPTSIGCKGPERDRAAAPGTRNPRHRLRA